MIVDFNLNPEEVEKIDHELKEKIGVEIEHEPFLTEDFSNLLMEENVSA